MKKASLLISALLISMSSMAQMYLWQDGNYTVANLDSITFRAPVLGDIPYVAPTAGAYTVVWNAVDYSECNGLVFAGNYNNYNITDVAAMAKFEKIEGYTNWYKAVITPTATVDHLEGRPCALAADGSFPSDWKHQWIGSEEKPCEVVKGEVEFQVEYGTETKMTVKEIGTVVYVRSYQFKVDPCIVEPEYDITFNLTVDQAMGAEDKVYVVGDFVENGWTTDAYEMTRKDDTHFTATIKAKIGREYKYVANGSWDYEMLEFPENGKNCSERSMNKRIDDVIVADYVYGFRQVNATWCGDTQYAVLDNFTISDYGLFGSKPNMIANSEKWVHLTNGDSLYCQLGTIYLRVWDEGLVYVNGKGFSGEGFHIIGEVPVYWVLEGEDAGKWIGNSNGFYIDTLGTKEYKPYTCKASDIDIQMYGDFWKQFVAYSQDTTNAKPDGNLYTNSQPGTNIVYYWPENNNATSWNRANVRYMNVKKVKDDVGNEELQYTIKVDWYDYFSDGYWNGLQVVTDETGETVVGIVEPYNMRLYSKEYTNMVDAESAPRKVKAQTSDEPQYVIGDQSRLHLGEDPFPADAKRVMKK